MTTLSVAVLLLTPNYLFSFSFQSPDILLNLDTSSCSSNKLFPPFHYLLRTLTANFDSVPCATGADWTLISGHPDPHASSAYPQQMSSPDWGPPAYLRTLYPSPAEWLPSPTRTHADPGRKTLNACPKPQCDAVLPQTLAKGTAQCAPTAYCESTLAS